MNQRVSQFRPSGYPSITATARVTEGLSLHGYTPRFDEPETRPMPDDETMENAVTGLFVGLAEPFADTGLEREVPDLLWSLTDLFHRKADRIQRSLDDNEDKQRASQQQQDGSEIRSVELERLTDKGIRLLELREAFERMRDQAASEYESHTGSVWRPRSGSMVNHKKITSAVIDSRDYISAKRKSESDVLVPAGPKILFAGGSEYNDHKLIWEVLDRVHKKHASMVLVHGGSPRGAERIASAWADNRKVTQIAFKPEWDRDGKSAPFKRNDRMLEVMPIGLVVFPGSGITDNLADKAKKQGILLSDYRSVKGP